MVKFDLNKLIQSKSKNRFFEKKTKSLNLTIKNLKAQNLKKA